MFVNHVHSVDSTLQGTGRGGVGLDCIMFVWAAQTLLKILLPCGACRGTELQSSNGSSLFSHEV